MTIVIFVFYIQLICKNLLLLNIYLKMYLEKQEKNKYTIGKVLRKLKRLRLTDSSAKIVSMPTELEQYYNQLVSKGLQVKNLKYAIFETRNGLKYSGLVATQKILSNTILVKVPVQCLLTTRDAFLSDIEKIFVQNPGFYAKRFSSEWQDRIILTFLLYEYQKGKNSKWFNLIRNLPRDIDYAIFWKKQQINDLEDQWIGRHIQKQKQRFQSQCNDLIKILKNYPQFFQPATITKQNIIWIHTHLVTRCFGKYFQYTTMVPFAQLFNHQCIDVYYTMYYKPGNPHDEKQQFYDQHQLTQKQIDQCESSDGSYDAQDFLQDKQFVQQKQGPVWDYSSQKNDQSAVKDVKSMLYHMFTFINFSDSISYYYIQIILKQLANSMTIKNWQERKRKCEQIHTLNVQYIRKIKEFYKKIKRKYYTYAITQKQKAPVQRPVDLPEQGVEYFEKEWPKDKFDQFYMLCSTKDQFQKGSQVFFCYGRLPNKLLLMRYGIALQHNKYDHMFIKLDIQKQIQQNMYWRAILKEIQVQKYRRFKIKRTKLCVQLIAYFRMQRWKYGQSLDNIFNISNPQFEIQVLRETKQFFMGQLSKYKSTLQKNQQKLVSKDIGYHKYFALVYKVQQQRMLNQQIKMIDYAIQILMQLKNGVTLKQVLEAEKSADKLTYQIMMETYFKMFQIANL